MCNDSRYTLLKHWITNDLGWQNADIQVASADASFRRYFRVLHNNTSTIAMDAPPDKEDTRPFVDITHRLLNAGVHAPEIIAEQTELGFLMLEDLGTTPYQDRLNPQSADQLYDDALQALLKLQKADTTGLPHYDGNLLYQEMALMPQWFLGTHLNIHLNTYQQNILEQCFQDIISNIEQQPTGFVHRDYHSRNLMFTPHNNPGIIDYQDAVKGPLSYDLVSLLRDCYIYWSDSQVTQWTLRYKKQASMAGVMPALSDDTFLKQFDLMGLQRHIKVLGIFARLKHRDNKPHYLNDLPLTLSYVLEIGKRHAETRPLVKLFTELKIADRIGTVEIPA